MRVIPVVMLLFSGTAAWAQSDLASAMKAARALSATFKSRVVKASDDGWSQREFPNDGSNARCAEDGEYEDHRFGCCPGLSAERVSNDAYICRGGTAARGSERPERPEPARCSRKGEYEDHHLGCCPGLSLTRVSNDAYVCE